MDYVKYNKRIVELGEENHGFAHDERTAVTGYAVIETASNKGALSVNVKNLEYFSGELYSFKVFFLGSKNGRVNHYYMGSLVPYEDFEARGHFRFSPGSLSGKELELSDFEIIVVAAASKKDPQEPLYPVLKGPLKQKGKGEKTLPKNKESHPPKDIAPGNQKDSDKSENKETRVKAASIRTYNNYYNEFITEECRKLISACSASHKVVPFNKDGEKVGWFRIAGADRLPILSGGGHSQATKYKHFILGESEDKYYIGVPGRCFAEEQPEKGLSGFVVWRPVFGGERFIKNMNSMTEKEKQNIYGYWIAKVDKKTGNIEEFKE